jgi:isopentenyl-diphosphate delta-isomerase
METQEVVLVDPNDRETGRMEKMQAHQLGILHRAFSIFILNQHGDMLIHQRSWTKYHGAGLWTNACCSHPYPEEPILAGAQRRLREEMGLECELWKIFDFVYRAEVENGLIEHEFDHVFVGFTNQNPQPNSTEACDWTWINLQELEREINLFPHKFTKWFVLALPRVLENLKIMNDHDLV